MSWIFHMLVSSRWNKEYLLFFHIRLNLCLLNLLSWFRSILLTKTSFLVVYICDFLLVFLCCFYFHLFLGSLNFCLGKSCVEMHLFEVYQRQAGLSGSLNPQISPSSSIVLSVKGAHCVMAKSAASVGDVSRLRLFGETRWKGRF